MLINKPVFEYSLKDIGESPRNAFYVWLVFILIPCGLQAAPKLLGLAQQFQFNPAHIAGFLIHPAFWCLLATGLGITQNFLGAGLIFTRNLNRFEYVFTLFAARCLLLFALMISVTLALQLSYLAMGTIEIFFNIPFLAQLAINTVSASAAAVLLCCLPLRIAVVLPLALTVIVAYDMVAGTYIVCNTDCEPTLNMSLPFLKPLHYWSSELCPQFPSLSLLADSYQFDWSAVITYLSNILLYLALSAWVLARRDFHDA